MLEKKYEFTPILCKSLWNTLTSLISKGSYEIDFIPQTLSKVSGGMH